MAKSILVVDDSPTVLALVKATLEKAGYEIETAIDGEQCLEKAKDTPPDLILLDVEMPNMDGYTTLRELKYGDKSTKNIPVVMLTSKGRLEDIFFLEGATDFIEKSQAAYQLLPQKISTVLGDA